MHEILGGVVQCAVAVEPDAGITREAGSRGALSRQWNMLLASASPASIWLAQSELGCRIQL
eukprot:6199257-Pleurochrysis_carterae.AAC.1